MYKDKYQTKLFSIFNSSGSGPLEGWVVERGYGSVRPAQDEELRTGVLDLQSPNVASTFISSPPPPHKSLGLGMRCITLMLKHLDHQPFSFEIQVVDDEDMRRRFRFSTYNREMKLTTFLTSMGLPLVPGWNIVQLDLAQFTGRAYNTMYIETLKVTIHANCHLRRVFFSDKLYSDGDLPPDYRLAPKGRPVAQPVRPASKLEEEQQVSEEGKVETKLEEKPMTKMEERRMTKIDGKQETKLEEKPTTIIEGKAETEVDGKAETKVEGKSETEVEEKTGTEVEEKTETEVEEKTETKVEGKTETELEGKTETTLEGKAGTEVERKTVMELEGGAEIELEGNVEAELEGEAEMEVEGEEGEEGEMEIRLEGETETKLEGKTESKLEGKEELEEG